MWLNNILYIELWLGQEGKYYMWKFTNWSILLLGKN